jgi:predicted nucleotidyltransferase component of viral defense system
MNYQSHHRYLLIQILKSVFTDTSLAPFLGFKGGTAAMLFYDLPRFSTDLDFDLLDKNKEEMVFEYLKNVLEKYCLIKKADNKRYTLFYLLSYENKQIGAPNIKVEINKRGIQARYEVMQYLGISMRVMIKEDMAANKLLAMYNRLGRANRDIFDVWYFFSNQWPINKRVIEDSMGVSYKKFLQMCIEALENFNDKEILTGVGELLDEKQRQWVQKNLKNETLFLLRFALSNESIE